MSVGEGVSGDSWGRAVPFYGAIAIRKWNSFYRRTLSEILRRL